jgi:hypothetical protein
VARWCASWTAWRRTTPARRASAAAARSAGGLDPKLVSEAVVAWLGHGYRHAPERNEARLVQRFGPDATARLLPVLRGLEEECWESNIADHAPTLVDMGSMLAAHMRARHPELSEDAIEALAWDYTFANK